jgi:cytochrome c5
VAATQPPRTTADAVYTAAQSARGRAQYETICQSCHGPALRGGVGRALIGDTFMRAWSGLTLDRLFERVHSMPPDATTPREDSVSIDLVAYMLAQNGFPAGSGELDPDALDNIVIEARDLEAVPNFSLVQVVGCLVRGTGREWLLSPAAAPIRTKDPSASSGDERVRAASLSPGTQTLRLLNVFPSPDELEGHFVEAKGFLIGGAVASLNVTAIASLAPDCPG